MACSCKNKKANTQASKVSTLNKKGGTTYVSPSGKKFKPVSIKVKS